MIKVRLIGHENYYALSDVMRLFWGNVKENKEQGLIYSETDAEEEIIVVSEVDSNNQVNTTLGNGEEVLFSANETKLLYPLDIKREVKRQLYIVLERYTHKSLPWGCLTGIRPTIIAGECDNYQDMMRKYLVREDKAKLAYEVGANETRILNRTDEEDINIYVGIPFCPSRCEYCSFVSQDIGHHLGRLKDYEQALTKEIEYLGTKVNRSISSLYFGGGTPTVLDDELFEDLLRRTFASFNITSDTEVTVEAGRPDTITEHKLDVIAELGVKRICINPQTMNNQTLASLNRRHTAEDIVHSYEMARERGIDIINMDLIAGLKYEDSSELISSLNKVISLEPANITIHTLYKKRRSAMSKNDIVDRLGEDWKLDKTLSEAYDILRDNGYIPYYMYRQKDTGHGLENVGFAKPGTECLYNVAMMTDGRDVLSCGAGGMSKRVYEETEPGKFRLERHSCVKDVLLYIQQVNDIAAGKADFFEL